MNWDRIEGNWKQAKGIIKERCGRLTNNYVNVIDGRRMKQLGKIQESYGLARDNARHRAREWKKGSKLQVVENTPDARRIADENAGQIGC